MSDRNRHGRQRRPADMPIRPVELGGYAQFIDSFGHRRTGTVVELTGDGYALVRHQWDGEWWTVRVQTRALTGVSFADIVQQIEGGE